MESKERNPMIMGEVLSFTIRLLSTIIVMRAATDKLVAFYKTQLGQDVIETLTNAGVVAGGQAIFTDMSAEEIALASALGIGAASVGRPVGGRLGQTVGTALDKRSSRVKGVSEDGLKILHQIGKSMGSEDIIKAKLAPFANQSPSAQLGQFLGRGYGDNIAQAAIGLAAPGLINYEND